VKIVLARFSTSLLIALSVISLLTVTGCSSNTPTQKSRYYLLNSHKLTPKATDKTTLSARKPVVISVLELPAYLHQPYLVLQLDAHQLHYARFDMWAEPLQIGLSKALLSDLNEEGQKAQYIASMSDIPVAGLNEVMIQIDYFHPNNHSKVTLSGHYWTKKEGKISSIQHPFSFELSLTQDGYGHAVSKMRQLVGLLAQKILQLENVT